jgi:hypothetical protein
MVFENSICSTGKFQALGNMVQRNVEDSKREGQTAAQKIANKLFTKKTEVCGNFKSTNLAHLLNLKGSLG